MVPCRSKAALDAAARVATAAVPFYERLYSMPYPLAKLDLVSDPSCIT